MAMELLTAPIYLKKSELEVDAFAFENAIYLGSEENPRSMYPGTAGAITYSFELEDGKVVAISGDHVFADRIKKVALGTKCGFFYKGKVSDKGEPVKYHNWAVAIDKEEQMAIKKKEEAQTVPQTNTTDLSGLE